MDALELLFVSLVQWRNHPGYLREGSVRPSIADCLREAAEAVELLEEFKRWQDGEQQLLRSVQD